MTERRQFHVPACSRGAEQPNATGGDLVACSLNGRITVRLEAEGRELGKALIPHAIQFNLSVCRDQTECLGGGLYVTTRNNNYCCGGETCQSYSSYQIPHFNVLRLVAQDQFSALHSVCWHKMAPTAVVPCRHSGSASSIYSECISGRLAEGGTNVFELLVRRDFEI